ncbi:MAG: DUF6498-containing protein [Microscillaceae bacterium]|jgi:hypothetical protein|nr:DUF6498-containing protein [Microscillaceae bacterium]
MFRLSANYPTFAFISTIASNLIPLLLIFAWQWSILSLLFLYWLECGWLIGLGLFYFIFVIRFDSRRSRRINRVGTWIFKTLLSTWFFLVLGAIWLLELWLISFSAIKRYNPSFELANLDNFWGIIRQTAYCGLELLPYNFYQEPLFLLGVVAVFGNYAYLLANSYLSLGKVIDEMNVTTRLMSSAISIFVIALLYVWYLYDVHNPEAQPWALGATIFFVLTKTVYEINVLVRAKPKARA